MPESSHPDGATILVVDDEPTLLALVRTMLWRAGYNVLEASGPGEALAVIEQHPGPIPLLLSDVLMPEMNGFELAERIKRMRPEIQVLFMTGFTDRNLLDSTGRMPGNVPLIRKPFTAHRLVHAIDGILQAQ